MFTNLTFPILSFLIAIFSIPVVIKIAIDKNLVDNPDQRKVHRIPIPALGGVAIMIALFICFIINFKLIENLQQCIVLISAFLLLILGVKDDIKPMKAGTKFLGQILIATLTVYVADIRISNFYGIFDIYTLPIGLSYLLSIFIILTFINSFNLIDGINGLAASLSIIFFVFFAFYFYDTKSHFYFLISISMVGSLIAFLRYNLINPKIFLGDCGALNLGYFASIFCIILLNSKEVYLYNYPIHAPYGLMLCLFIIPLFDTMRVFFIRLIHLRSPFSPDKKHIHHLFLRLGLQHYHITFLLVLITLMYLLLGLLFQDAGDIVIIVSVFALCILGILIVEFLIKKRIREGVFKMPIGQTIYQIIAQNWFWFVCIVAYSLPFMRWSSSIPLIIMALFWLITFQKANFKSILENFDRIIHFTWMFFIALIFLLVHNDVFSAEAWKQIMKLSLFLVIPVIIQSRSHKFLIKYFAIYLSFFLTGILTFCFLSLGISVMKTIIFKFNTAAFVLSLFDHTDLPKYVVSLFLIISVLFSIQLKNSNIIILRNKWINSSLILFLLYFQFLNNSIFGIVLSILLFFFYALYSVFRYKNNYFLKVFVIYFIGIIGLDIALFHSSFFTQIASFSFFEIEPIKSSCWNASFNLIMKKPLIGYGMEYKSLLLQEIANIQYIEPTALIHLNSYNQFLEYWLKFGIFGLIGSILMFGYFIYVSFLKRDIVMFLFNIIYILFNLFESFFESQAGIVFFVLTNCFFLMKLNKQKIKLTQKTELYNFKRYIQINYFLFDFIVAFIAWTCLFTYRKLNEVMIFNFYHDVIKDFHFFSGTIIISCFWLILYFYFGFYSEIQKKSRFAEFMQTFVASLLGVVIVFFAVIVDDKVPKFTFYYKYFIFYFAVHFTLTYLFRYLNIISYRYFLKAKKIHFNAVLIGNKANIIDIHKQIHADFKAKGKVIIGYFAKESFDIDLPYLGSSESLNIILDQQKVDEVIIAYNTKEHKLIFKIFNDLSRYKVFIKIIPDLFDIVSNSLKTNAAMGPLLIEIDNETIPLWQRNIKYTIDYLVAGISIIIFSPLFIFIALLIKLDSKGNVFYYQERIGFDGKKFKIIKFRSMKMNAEQAKPLLSSDNDDRITKVGKILRKWRLDELPQFFNILMGEMSLIGYRAEREYFIKQIIEKNPHYQFLFKIKPGITSMGMINFGYAENVDEMLDRLKYDLVYLKNMSLSLDLKIFMYTIIILIEGRGK